MAKFGNPENPYLFEYIGRPVIDVHTDQILGKVEKIEENGVNPVFIISLNSFTQDKVMVPMRSPYIVSLKLNEEKLLTKDIPNIIC